MGPSSFNDGDLFHDGDNGIPVDASMGPSSFNDGDFRICSQPQKPFRASMGPSSFNDGDTDVTTIVKHTLGSFNGAVVFQRRRRCHCRPTPVQRHRFNGAVVFQRRRLRVAQYVETGNAAASMGPSSFNDGDDGSKSVIIGHKCASMGPSSFNDGDEV